MPQGITNNPHGRKVGTPNKITIAVKERLQQIFDGVADNLPSKLDMLEPREQLEFIVKLLPYITPRMQSVTTSEEPKDYEIVINRTVISTEEYFKDKNLNSGMM